MKPLIGLLLITILVCSCVSNSTIPMREEIVRLRSHDNIYVVDGGAVGAGGGPGKFYLLSHQVAEQGTQQQFYAMLDDPNPVVRTMGLVCLAIRNFDYDILSGDKSEIEVCPSGCISERMTIEEFSEFLKEDSIFRDRYIDSSYTNNVVTKWPRLIHFTAPDTRVDPSWVSTNLHFEVRVTLDSQGQVEHMRYTAKDVSTRKYDESDWRLDVVQEAMNTVSNWTFSALYFGGEPHGVVIDFIFHVSITNQTSQWIINDLYEDLIYDSKDGSTLACPIDL